MRWKKYKKSNNIQDKVAYIQEHPFADVVQKGVLEALRPATLLKRDSNTLSEHPFYRALPMTVSVYQE